MNQTAIKDAPSKRGGARPGAGRKPGSKPQGAIKKGTPSVAPGAAPDVAISASVLKEGKRMALAMQRRVATESLQMDGVAPLDVLHSVMFRLLNRANAARDAGGVLLTVVAPTQVFNPDGSPAMTTNKATGEPELVFTDPKWYFDSETSLLVACADAANKAAAYVHPKLAAIDHSVKTETFEETVARMAAKHNLAPGGEIREVQANSHGA